MTTMTVEVGDALMDLIVLAYEAGVSLLLRGPSGIGKSVSMRTAAAQLDVPLWVTDLSLCEPIDLLGCPSIEEGRTRYAPPSFLPDRGPGLWLFEELPSAPREVRRPLKELLTSHRLNDWNKPEGIVIMATGNPKEAGYDVDADGLGTALEARFSIVDVVAPGRVSWSKWARQAALHPDVISHVLEHPGSFKKPASPRSWSMVSELVFAYERQQAEPSTLVVAMAGLIGKHRALAFTREYLGAKPIEVGEILDCWTESERLRKLLFGFFQSGRLDLVARGTLRLVRFLESPDGAAALGHHGRRENLLAYLHDLGEGSGDLKEQAVARLMAAGIL